MTNQVIIYNTEDGLSQIRLKAKDGTVWLTEIEIAELFETSRQNINKHIRAILKDGELDSEKVVRTDIFVADHGAMENRTQTKQIAYYNLDMILAVGYRVRSSRGMEFRRYATKILKEYLIKGFAMDDERLKAVGGGDYFKELLARIRDIRSSELVFYKQVLEIFSTAVDYDGSSKVARSFFATIQNKMHYAIHHQTASEVVYNRVDGEKEHMGMTVFKGTVPTLSEAKVAKNYLSEDELKGLNTLVSGYLDFAERMAQREKVMTMQDWLNHVDSVLTATGEELLQGKGSVSREAMEDKVKKEYGIYREKNLTQVERDFFREIKAMEQLAKNGDKKNG